MDPPSTVPSTTGYVSTTDHQSTIVESAFDWFDLGLPLYYPLLRRPAALTYSAQLGREWWSHP
ncbi:hypothetical protein LguiB_005885 [Lonicera macranthoides]